MMGDTSMLQPLSVRDAIWLSVESGLRHVEKAEFDSKKAEFDSKKFELLNNRFDQLFLALQDLCYVDIHNNSLHQVNAFKGGKKAPKVRVIESKELPSSRYYSEKHRRDNLIGKSNDELEQERAEQERKEQERHNALIRRLVQMGQTGERKVDD